MLHEIVLKARNRGDPARQKESNGLVGDRFAVQRSCMVALSGIPSRNKQHPASLLTSRSSTSVANPRTSAPIDPDLHGCSACYKLPPQAPRTLYLGVHVSGPKVRRIHDVVLVLERRPRPH